MKCILLTVLIGFFTSHTITRAQCAFNPTVFPANLVLCPQASDTLWTKVYDTYQWYKGGKPITGATKQYLVVDYYYFAGTMVSVAGTLDNCTEMSPQVLVDGWMFLPPTVKNSGNYTFNGTEFLVCIGDTIYFEFMLPYDTNIQWTENGKPISGATTNLLSLTSSVITSINNYGVYGSPSACPDFVQYLGVDLPIKFIFCPSGINENNQGSTVNIYPIPFSSQTTLQTDMNIRDATLTVYNSFGQIVKEIKKISGQTITLFRDNLPKGLYFIRLKDENKIIAVAKLVIVDN